MIYGDGGGIRIESSLPKLLYGNNLSSVSNAQPALKRLREFLKHVEFLERTFSDAVQEWREQIAANLKPSTVRAAESHLSQHIVKRLGNLPLQQANVKHLQAFVTTTAATGVTRKTLENILQTVFSILRTARMFGHTIPPVKRADLMPPREEAKRDVRFLSAKDVGQIITRAKEPHATMFAVLGMTGCRAGEMPGLKIGDLDFNRKVIYIRRSIDSRTKAEQSNTTKNSTGECRCHQRWKKGFARS